MSFDTDPVLQLGRDLAEALDHSDVVGRWMSHHLAELINRCEASADDADLAATTRNVVLQLWEHKCGAAFKTEPYGYVRPVLRAVARLDADPDPWAHYRPFGEQSPNTEALATYPLLETACNIDREVGQLVRLSVAIAAREATSREEPWVIAGMETADTEEDRAVRALEQLMRRLQTRVRTDVPEALQPDDQATVTLGGAHPAAPLPNDVGTEGTAAVRGTLPDPADRSQAADALTTALGSAVIRCRRLIGQLAQLCEERAMIEAERGTSPTGRAARRGQAGDGIDR